MDDLGDACTSVVVTPDNQYIICARGDYRICILGTQNKDVKFTFADCHGGKFLIRENINQN